MSRTIRVFFVDAFTDAKFRGNPAGVALDAEHLTQAEMTWMADQLYHGDWVFVLPPSSSDADMDVRFFSPHKELPFVGHATLAAHAVLARVDPRPRRRQQGKSGIVEVTSLPDTNSFSIKLPPPPVGRLIEDVELHEVLDLLGLQPGQLDPLCPPRIAGDSGKRLLLGLRDTAALDAARPRLAELAALSGRIGAPGYFLFVRSGIGGLPVTESRMFCPALGIDEDPVSGNAHAMLGVYLYGQGLLKATDGVVRFTGLQGRHVNRAGEVRVELQVGAAGGVIWAHIAGQAVIIADAQLNLP